MAACHRMCLRLIRFVHPLVKKDHYELDCLYRDLLASEG